MKRYCTRTISFALTLAMVCQLMPMQSHAAAADSPETAQAAAVTDASSAAGKTPASILGEIEELREEDTKHFRLSDGTNIAVSYGLPVHYRDAQGGWEDIDNRLVTGESSDLYSADHSGISMEFAATLDTGHLFTSTDGEVSVSMSLLDTAQAFELTAASVDLDILSGTAEKTAESSAEDSAESTMSDAAISTSVSAGDASAGFGASLTYSRSVTAQIDNSVPSLLNLGNDPGWDINAVIPQNLQSSLLYEEVFPDVDLLYTAFSHHIKEQIIVKEPQDAYRYDFLLDLEGLSAVLNDDGSISLLDAGDEERYLIPAPYMEDGAGTPSLAVDYTLQETAQGTILTVEADKEWIGHEERVFPVRIDPTLILTSGGQSGDIYSTFVSKTEPSTSYYGQTLLDTGSEHLGKEFRAFLYINNLPDIPGGCEIVNAGIALHRYYYHQNNCPQYPVVLYGSSAAVPTGFTDYLHWFQNMTWNNMPSVETGNIIDYQIAKEGSGYTTWDLTELVKEWYQGDEKRIISFSSIDVSAYTARAVYYSASSLYPPVLLVSYRSNTGIEPYYTYNTMSAGSAGTAYVSDFSGQLKAANTILTYSSVVNPFALEMVYNSDHFQKDASAQYLPAVSLGLNMHMGNGWTLNVVQKIEETTISEKSCLKYRDGDGTDHYFYQKDDASDTAYYDEDGLGLKIEVTGSGAYRMSDDKGNVWEFSDSFLTSLTDENGNAQLISYNANSQISSVSIRNKDTAQIMAASFEYDDIRLTAVNDAAGNRYLFTYSADGRTLNSVTMQYAENGETKSRVLAEYSYSGLRLAGMRDVESDYALEFTYDNGKVSHFQEKTGGSVGAQAAVTYSTGQKTSYHDPETGLYTHYLFDYEGRTVNAYSTYGDKKEVLGASNAAYHEKADRLDKSANRITQTASIGRAACQLMRNGGMEDTTNVWYPHGGGEVIFSPENARTGSYVFKGTLSETTTYADNHILSDSIEAGKTYTFSAYVDTSDLENITGTGVYVQVVNGSDVWYSSRVNYATADAVNDGWVRVSVTFQAKTTGAHTLCICGNGAEGVFYADDAQLEEAEAPSNVNLMENGSIRLGTYGWVLGQNAAYVDGVGITPMSIRIHGDGVSEDASAAYQVVPVNLPGSESYVLSGWVKANAVPDDLQTATEAEQDKNKQCGLRAVVTYSDDTAPEYHYAAFDPDIEDWQFVSMPIVPKQYDKTVASIKIICAYEKNVNTAYFDDISLVREMAQTMVYEDGKLRSVTATDLDTETYSYDGNNNLIKQVTGGSGVFNYTYDTTYKHRLTSVTNGQITQSMTYDGVGNTTSSKLTNSTDGKYIEASTAYTTDGNHVHSVTDAAGGTTTYDYGSGNTVMWGLPVSVTTADGTVTSTEYDATGRVVKTGIANTADVLYTYNKGLLGSIRRTADRSGTDVTQTYSMGYDVYGNMTSVQVGSRALASYEYDSLRRLSKMTYGNGQAVTYTYDEYGRTQTLTYPDSRVVTYSYNGDGSVHSISESGGDSPGAYVYEYDSLGRLMTWEKRSALDGLSSSQMYVTQDFDASNRLIFQSWRYPADLTFTNRYAYNLENGTMSAMDVGNDHVTFTYDSLLRLTAANGGISSRSYTYRDITDTKTTSHVTKLLYPNLEGTYDFEYTYDSMGNIASYTTPSGNTMRYTYDAQGQLLQADDGSTYTYTYDGGGNLLTAGLNDDIHTYTYGDGSWKDLLTAYDDQTITYDQVGNPLSYYNGTRWTFTWGNGRRLKTASDGTDSVSYTYDAEGLRTTKTVNGVVHTYYYSEGLLRRETYGETTLDFFYDANGVPFSMLHNRSTLYYYITNLEGDVIKLVDTYGNTAAMYKYDPYGGEVYATGSHAEINPLRYRGYYYDAETQMYYVSSRYYDPEIGRWINADAYTSTGQGILGNNMFVYCNNSPVSYVDKTGERMVLGYDPELSGSAYTSADMAIILNKSEILDAAETYDVDPYVLAGCIYVEQKVNYNIIDKLTDVPLYFMDTSVGLGQIKISNVRMLEENGYVDIVGSGITKDLEIARKLQYDSAYNANCCAAYLSYLQMRWEGAYDVSQDPAIWGSLYNLGERTPHSNPQPSEFGEKVGRYYSYMKILLD